MAFDAFRKRTYPLPPPPPPTTFGDEFGGAGQFRVGGQGGTGQLQNTGVTAMTPNRATVVNRIGGTGGTGMPVNKGMAPLAGAINPYAEQADMMIGGRGPGSAIDKLPGYVDEFVQSNDKTGGVRPGVGPEMNAVEAERARQRAMATPSGAPGIGGTGGSALDPRQAALNGYR